MNLSHRPRNAKTCRYARRRDAVGTSPGALAAEPHVAHAGPAARPPGRRRRSDRVESHARRPRLSAGHPERARGRIRPRLRSAAAGAGRGPGGGGPPPGPPGGTGRPIARGAGGRDLGGLLAPVHAPLRPGRRGARAPAGVSAARPPDAARRPHAAAVPPRLPRRLGDRRRRPRAAGDAPHPRPRRRQPEQPHRLVPLRGGSRAGSATCAGGMAWR